MGYKIKNGDCFEVLKKIKSQTIDLALTDPPYTMTKRGKSCRPNWMPSNMGDNVFDGVIPNPDIWISEIYRVLKEGTHFYTFCNTNDIRDYLNAADSAGFKLHNIITMIKDTGMPNRWYLKNCELILFFRKGKAKPINNLESRDWYNVTMPKESSGKYHITQKPLKLITELVTNSTLENEVVLDPFMGSGTTGVACLLSNRNFVGIEKDEKYFNSAKARLEKAKTTGKDSNIRTVNLTSLF